LAAAATTGKRNSDDKRAGQAAYGLPGPPGPLSFAAEAACILSHPGYRVLH
jgi:hypothetical protein